MENYREEMKLEEEIGSDARQWLLPPFVLDILPFALICRPCLTLFIYYYSTRISKIRNTIFFFFFTLKWYFLFIKLFIKLKNKAADSVARAATRARCHYINKK